MAKLALLIGVSEYDLGLNPLPAAVKDVQAIADVLQHPDMGGFGETDIIKLANPEPQKMQEAIETLFSDRRKDDLILLYFSGHGIKDETGKLYLATCLTRKNSQGRLVKATAVPANFIHSIMSESRSRRQVVILDCCFSGAFAEGLSAKDDGSVDIYTQLGGEGRVVLTSSTSTQYSFQQEGENLSVYTRYIVEGIATGAADQDNDGVISIDELHEYAKKKVKEAAPAMQPEIYAVKEGFKIRLAKAPIGDPKLKYRQEVERFASRGAISAIGRNTLDLKRQSLGLLPEEANIIETEVLKPYQEYQERLRRYEQVLVEEINQQYPLSQDIKKELNAFQEALGLKDQDVEPIFARVTQPKEPILETVEKPNNSLLIPEAIANTKSTNPIKKAHSSPQELNKVKGSRSRVVVIFATILGLTGTIYGIYALAPYFPTKFSHDTPEPSPTPSSSSVQSTPDATPKNTQRAANPTQSNEDIPIPKPINLATPSAAEKQLPAQVAAELEEQRQRQAKIQAEAQATLERQKQLQVEAQAAAERQRQAEAKIQVEAQAALERQRQAEAAAERQRQAEVEAAAEKQRQFEAARLSCVQEKNRYKILLAEGAVNAQAAINALNKKNCSDYGITWP